MAAEVSEAGPTIDVERSKRSKQWLEFPERPHMGRQAISAFPQTENGPRAGILSRSSRLGRCSLGRVHSLGNYVRHPLRQQVVSEVEFGNKPLSKVSHGF
ncbi:protein of unknown function [Burkholderia multivorans]